MTPKQAETLTRVEQKLNDMCSSNTREHSEIKEDLKRTEDKMDNRIKPVLFYWVLGGVFACLLILGSMVMDIKDDLEMHMDRARHAFEDITGHPYVPPESLKK